MAIVLKDRVKETTATTGTADFVLGGSSSGYDAFSVIGPNNYTYYCCYDQATGDWEVGIGQYTTAAGGTLVRDTVLDNSAATTNKISFASGPKDLFITYPAKKAIYEEASGNVLIDGGPITVVGNGVTGYTTFSAALGEMYGNVDSFAQLYARNLNDGTEASADMIVYRDNTVSDSANFLDMGINSSNFSSLTWPIFTAGSMYLYGDGGEMFVGSGTDDLVFFTGGVDVTDEAARFNKLTKELTTQASINVTGDVNAQGGTFTSPVTTSSSMVSPSSNEFVTKAYVDNAASAGLTVHPAVRVEAIGNLNATYNNGTAGVGATLTNAGTQAALVLDGVTMAVNDRVLVMDQTNQTQNGVYVVTNIGSGSTNWVLTRASDADTYGVNNPNALDEGAYFFVQEGNTAAFESYTCTTVGVIVFGTTNITFSQFSSVPQYVVNSPLQLSGNTLSLTTVPATLGGTGTATVATGDLLYGSATNTWSKLPAGAAYRSLVMNASGTNVEWNAVALNQSGAVSGSLPATNGGTGQNAYAVGDILYSPSTNTLTVLSGNTTTTKKFLGQTGTGTGSAAPVWQQPAASDITGLAASATTDTTNASNISSGTLPSGRLSGSYTGITGVGTLTAGTWNGSTVGPTYGGTGFASYAVGDLLYADTTTSLAKLADVATGNALISGGVGSAPSWGKVGLATHVSGTLPIANGGTNATATPTAGAVAFGTGTAYNFNAAGTSGQVLTSAGAGTPTWTTATNANTASAIVQRDASGNFSAGTITATLSGNASTATTATNQSGGTVAATTGSFSGVVTGTAPINLAGATYSTQANFVGNWAGAGWWGLGSESGHIIKFDQVATASNASPTWVGATDVTLKLGTATVLSSSNYTSYSPSLTGTGASGTWSINVTGSAGSATSAGYLTGGDSSFYAYLYNSNSGDLNTYNSPGLYSSEYTGTTNRPVGSSGHWIQISDAVGTDVKTQWYFESSGVTPYMRLQWGNGTWRSWQALLTSGNYTSYSPSLTGSGASGTWGINVTGSAGSASTATTASNLSGFTNSSSSNPVAGPDNLTNNGHAYVTGVSLFGQTDGALYAQAYSTAWVHQIYGDYRTGQLAVRGKNSGTWQSWRTVLDSSNYGSYAAPRYELYVDQSSDSTTRYYLVAFISANNGSVFIRGNIGGHDGPAGGSQGAASINLSVFSRAGSIPVQGYVGGNIGNQDLLVYKDASNNVNIYVKTTTWALVDITYGGTGGSTLYNAPSYSTTAPSGTLVWAASSNQASSTTGVNVTGALTQAGSQVLTAGNYNSYSPTLTGTGASGTWGINVTGSAASVAVHAGNEINCGGSFAGGGTLYFNYNDGGAYSNLSIYNGGTSLATITAANINSSGDVTGRAVTAGTATNLSGGSVSATTVVSSSYFSSGTNIGVGVTPATTWGTTIGNNKVIELYNNNYIASYTANATTPSLYIVSNALYTSTGWQYQNSGASRRAAQFNVNGFGGVFSWLNAPSGTAGGAVTFVQAMNLDSSRNLNVGPTTITGAENLTYFKFEVANNYSRFGHINTVANGTDFIKFDYNGVQIGGINQASSTTVAYATSSDYRLKENVAPLTGALAKVAALKPCTYTWKSTGEHGEGFIAHELQEVCPQAVTGVKDGMQIEEYIITHAAPATHDEDGNELTPEVEEVKGTREIPAYQGIDTSFLVATLTAAIQEQQALIVSLTERIAALESK